MRLNNVGKKIMTTALEWSWLSSKSLLPCEGCDIFLLLVFIFCLCWDILEYFCFSWSLLQENRTLDMKGDCLVAEQAYYFIIMHDSQKVVEIHALVFSFFKFLLFPNTFFNRKNIFLNLGFQWRLLFPLFQPHQHVAKTQNAIWRNYVHTIY